GCRGRLSSAVVVLLAACTPLAGCGDPLRADRSGPTVLWTYRDAAGAQSVPYADGEIAIFSTISENRVVALDAGSGAKRWERRLELPHDMRNRGFPIGRLVGAGDIVVVPAWDLYGLDKRTGVVRWKFAPPDDFPGAGVMLGEDGYLYSTGHHLYRIDPATGQVLWRADLGEQPFAPVERDGVVYVGTRGVIPGSSGALGAGHAFAVEAATGRVLWRTPIPAPEDRALGGVTGAGAVTAELFIVSSHNSRVYGLDRRTGEVRWTTKGSGYYGAGVVVIGDVAITAGDAGFVEGFDVATGAQRWKVNIGQVTDPLATNGQSVLAVTGRLWAVSVDGSVLWRHDAGESVPYSTGAWVHDRTIYIGTSYGNDVGFFALRAPG
ncbi:MAG: PQQ-like beta-propeller repeat protein, partial [Gemmatimonadetes bacterium]|nr:PQQ-like beta-propeller repeat protein [Gemmatimonadota bacterium]